MSYRFCTFSVAGLVGWLFKPITAPIRWLFKHRCKLEQDNTCADPYCDNGKKAIDGWGTSNGRWVKRGPLPITFPKAPPQPGIGRYYSESQLTVVTVAGNEVTITAPLDMTIDIDRETNIVKVSHRKV